MTLKNSATAIGLAIFVLAGAAQAQEAPPVEVFDTGPAAPAQATTGPEWWVFSTGETRAYLIDVNSVAKTGDELTVSVARVARDKAAGDYSHTVDQFGIRCRARQSHVVTSSEALEDGTLDEAFATDEPWEAIVRNSLDEAIHQIACDDMRPEPPSYASVKAYIDAGRP